MIFWFFGGCQFLTLSVFWNPIARINSSIVPTNLPKNRKPWISRRVRWYILSPISRTTFLSLTLAHRPSSIAHRPSTLAFLPSSPHQNPHSHSHFPPPPLRPSPPPSVNHNTLLFPYLIILRGDMRDLWESRATRLYVRPWLARTKATKVEYVITRGGKRGRKGLDFMGCTEYVTWRRRCGGVVPNRVSVAISQSALLLLNLFAPPSYLSHPFSKIIIPWRFYHFPNTTTTIIPFPYQKRREGKTKEHHLFCYSVFHVTCLLTSIHPISDIPHLRYHDPHLI